MNREHVITLIHVNRRNETSKMVVSAAYTRDTLSSPRNSPLPCALLRESALFDLLLWFRICREALGYSIICTQDSIQSHRAL